MFHTNVVEKIKTHSLDSITFPPKNHDVYGIMDTYCRVGESTDDSTIRSMPIECWIPKATNIYSEYVIFFIFHYKNGWTKAP